MSLEKMTFEKFIEVYNNIAYYTDLEYAAHKDAEIKSKKN